MSDTAGTESADDDGRDGGQPWLLPLVVLGVLIIIVRLVWVSSVIIVKHAESVVLERFSKFHRILESGINIVVPFIDVGRQFTWTRVEMSESGVPVMRTIDDVRIDLRESVFNFQEQQVFTKDTVLVDVDAVMYYRIFDVKKAVYEIEDLQSALCNTAQTQLKEVFGNLTFTQALQSQTQINEHLAQEFGKIFTRWGVECIRMELRNLKPNDSQQIAQSMKKQMVAERHRRGEFIRAEGEKTAMRLEAEGNKVKMMNLGIANQEATRKRSEGEKEAKIEIAYSESRSLEFIGDVLKAEPGQPSQADYMMSQRYLEMFGAMTSNRRSNSTVYLPYDISSLSGTIAKLPEAYGVAAERPLPDAATLRQRPATVAGASGAASKGQQFSMLD